MGSLPKGNAAVHFSDRRLSMLAGGRPPVNIVVQDNNIVTAHFAAAK